MRPDYVETGPLKAWKACAVLEPHSECPDRPWTQPMLVYFEWTDTSTTNTWPAAQGVTGRWQDAIRATEQEAAVAEILRPWCG